MGLQPAGSLSLSQNPAGSPACKPQCVGSSVGDMLSNELITTQPNSDANTLGNHGPVGAGVSCHKKNCEPSHH
jgi:hypothetical protein